MLSCWTLHRLGLEAVGDPSAPGDLRWCKTKRKMWRCNDSGARDSHHRQKSGNKTGCEACTKTLPSSVTMDVLLSPSVCTAVHAFPHLWGKIPVRTPTPRWWHTARAHRRPASKLPAQQAHTRVRRSPGSSPPHHRLAGLGSEPQSFQFLALRKLACRSPTFLNLCNVRDETQVTGHFQNHP